MRNPPTPLTPNEESALEQLEERFEVDGDPLAHEAVVDHLVTAGFVPGAAGDLIDQLCVKGYLYAVEGELHLTDA
jgi:hypothetical protein